MTIRYLVFLKNAIAGLRIYFCWVIKRLPQGGAKFTDLSSTEF
jgi:hypothetical protein